MKLPEELDFARAGQATPDIIFGLVQGIVFSPCPLKGVLSVSTVIEENDPKFVRFVRLHLNTGALRRQGDNSEATKEWQTIIHLKDMEQDK